MVLRSATLALLLASAPALADTPRSAIPWLSDSLEAPPAAEPEARPAGIVGDGTNGAFEITSLDRRYGDEVGLLPPARSGLRRDLWGTTSALRARKLISSVENTGVPAAQALFRRLLLAELDPPVGGGARPSVLIARLDQLLAMGALDQAEALIDRAGLVHADVALRAFDVGLLTGRVEEVCQDLASNPNLSPTLPARIYCLAQLGDPAAADVTLSAGTRLGTIAPIMANHLAHFLDPEGFEDAPLPEMPSRLTPLYFALREALFLPRPATALPRAFLYRDLDRHVPPRRRIAALERLTASGAIDGDRLFAAYRAQRAATSGGVWGRAEAVQALDTALAEDDRAALLDALRLADRRLGAVGLRVALARAVAPALAEKTWPGAVPAVAAELLLLGDAAEALGRIAPDNPVVETAQALALQRPLAQTPRRMLSQPEARAAAAYSALNEALPQAEAPGAAQILIALGQLDAGEEIGAADLYATLRTLRMAGLSDAARRIAVETLLLQGH
ncbi:MAG: hypothetical protein AAGE18_16420 [Pseudomonadota bacterium]